MAIKIFGEKGITFQFVKIFLTTVSLKCFVQCKTVTGETKFNKYQIDFLYETLTPLCWDLWRGRSPPGAAAPGRLVAPGAVWQEASSGAVALSGWTALPTREPSVREVKAGL